MTFYTKFFFLSKPETSLCNYQIVMNCRKVINKKNNKKHMHDQEKYDATEIHKKYQHKLHNTYN